MLEEELRGQNGLRTVVRDQDGSVVRVEETVKAVPGHTVQLTLNQTVQAAAQKGLADRISYLNKNAPATRGKEAEAGAVVAIDVKPGGVIARASYPAYSLTDDSTGSSELEQLSSGRLWGGERSRTCKAVSAFCYSFTLRVSGGCRWRHAKIGRAHV